MTSTLHGLIRRTGTSTWGVGSTEARGFLVPWAVQSWLPVLMRGFSYLVTSLLARGQRASQLTAPCPARPCERLPAPTTAAAPRSAEQPCLWLPFLQRQTGCPLLFLPCPVPHAVGCVTFAQSERGWPHWVPACTLPRAGSPKWHSDAERRLQTFVRDHNHGLGQVSPLPSAPLHTPPPSARGRERCLSPAPHPLSRSWWVPRSGQGERRVVAALCLSLWPGNQGKERGSRTTRPPHASPPFLPC